MCISNTVNVKNKKDRVVMTDYVAYFISVISSDLYNQGQLYLRIKTKELNFMTMNSYNVIQFLNQNLNAFLILT